MDPDRFDALSRPLIATGSRRRAVAAVGGALGLLGLAHPDEATAAKSGKCKPKCGACEKCKRGDCDRKDGRKRCKKGKCQPKADGAACAERRCCGGACVDTSNDPRNCGSCDTRCQVNAVCSAGTCTCVRGVCDAADAACCPTTAARPEACRCTGATDPRTCETAGSLDLCPAGTVACLGPRCGSCCPTGTTCDTSTGTCLQ